MPDPVVEQCQNCKWWQRKLKTDVLAECHRYAPRPDVSQDQVAKWKLTTATNSCGDFVVIPKK